MTSEIAIMNKTAIALAADSAVTVTGRDKQKVHNTANKLFALSKHHPVGIMVYGSAELIDVPWETIIKVYRKELGNKSFNHLEQYAEHFIDFFNKENYLFPPELQRGYFQNVVYCLLYYFLKEPLLKKISDQFSDSSLSEIQIQAIIEFFLAENVETWKDFRSLTNKPIKITSSLKQLVQNITKTVFENLPLSLKAQRTLEELCSLQFSKFIPLQQYSGVVIAGFGDKDVFPSLSSFDIRGIVENQLIYSLNNKINISIERTAHIQPFAQSDSVITFLKGIEPSIETLLKNFFQEYFNDFPLTLIQSLDSLKKEEKSSLLHRLKQYADQSLSKFHKDFNNHTENQNIQPMFEAIKSLPKEELPSMAESLVNLASIKQRISNETETVGGPIDVAVISKGDGFVWIKRKYYFKPDLNPHYFNNHYNILDKETTK